MLWWWIVSTTGIIVNKSAFAVRFPNEIVETPIVTCEPDRVVIRIRTSTANPSTIYAEDFYHSPGCMVRDENTIVIRHGECGMTTEHMDNPSGIMYRICISVQIHPLFVTDSDRSYCAQCVYMENSIVDDLEQNIAISEIAPSELEPQFDDATSPQCAYSIRKGSFDGPEVHAAVVGETVFHVWRCGGNGNIGILVQNCHVEDLQGNKILIIDQNGCGIDSTVFRTPQYSNDLQTAFLESNVFKFVDKSMTRFRCQLRLCVKNRGGGCEQVTPPSSCPNFDETDEGVRNRVEDISVRSKSVEKQNEIPIPNGPPAPPPVSIAAAPTHSRQRLTTTVSPFTAARSYGLSTAHVVDRSSQSSAPNRPTTQLGPTRKRRSTTFHSSNGSILLNRTQRAISIGGQENELPELDVVGLIRVLDNPEDLQFLDDNSDDHHSTQANVVSGVDDEQQKCISSQLYWLLVGSIGLLVGVQIIAVVMCVVQRTKMSRHQKWMR